MLRKWLSIYMKRGFFGEKEIVANEECLRHEMRNNLRRRWAQGLGAGGGGGAALKEV